MKSLIRGALAAFYFFQLSVLPIRAEESGAVPELTAATAEGDQVILTLSQLMPYEVFTLTSPQRLVIEIPGTLYKAGFSKKTLDTPFVKRIRGYQFKESPLISRVVIDLASAVDYTSTAADNQVILTLRKNAVLEEEAKKPAPKARTASTSSSRKKDLLSSLPQEVVSLDFESADIRDVIRLMAETSNINIIFGPEVSGSISIHLKNVPFDEAFSTILNLKGLVATQLGANILRVTTPDILQRERQKAIVYTKTIPVNYLKAEEMQKHIVAVMSSSGRKGTITVASETNSLVITDSEEGIGQAERLIAQLDQKPKQVMIEARIVEINLNNGFDIGVTWELGRHFNREFDPATGNLLSRKSIGGFSEDQANVRVLNSINGQDVGAVAPPNGTGVSLPGPAGASISFGIVKAGETLFDVALAALVSESKAKILSAPKVVTINGEAARIEAVQDIRFRTSTVSNGVVTSDFKTVSAGIILSVTPTINAEDRITLRIKPESSFPTQESTDAGPIIRTRTAQTTVIIKDGETLVIGGLIDDQDSKGVSKVPILGDIPIIGAFFRSNTTRKIRNELLVFVTPRIVRD